MGKHLAMSSVTRGRGEGGKIRVVERTQLASKDFREVASHHPYRDWGDRFGNLELGGKVKKSKVKP